MPEPFNFGICETNRSYDRIDLSSIPNDYFQRCNYSPCDSISKYITYVNNTPWGTKYTDEYRIFYRLMVGSDSERTLSPAIAPKNVGHIDTVFGMAFRNVQEMLSFAGVSASIPFDYLIRATKKRHIRSDVVAGLPVLSDTKYSNRIRLLALLLNSLTQNYSELYSNCYEESFKAFTWSKQDTRLSNKRFKELTAEWKPDYALRTDYERRYALIEIDVLTAMALNMSLEDLKTIYRVQFPVSQQYEQDTWYDNNGRIVFTNSKSLVGVGFDRKEWEGNVKGAPTGKVFTREIEDDTMPGGPVKRTIEYVAPFDKCDREQDYETAWRFFEEKYKQ